MNFIYVSHVSTTLLILLHPSCSKFQIMPYIIVDPVSDFGKLKDYFFDKYSIPWKPKTHQVTSDEVQASQHSKLEKSTEATEIQANDMVEIENIVKLDHNANVGDEQILDNEILPSNDHEEKDDLLDAREDHKVVIDYKEPEINLVKECFVRLKKIHFEDVDVEYVLEDDNETEGRTESKEFKSGKKKVYSVELKRQVGQFAQTHDVTTTSHKFGVSKNSVIRWRKQFKVEDDVDVSNNEDVDNNDSSSPTADDACVKSSPSDTAARFGLSRTTVKKLAMDKPSGSRRKRIKYCSKLKEDVMKYYEDGHSREETAKKFNVSVSVVKHIRFLEKKKKAKVDVKEDIVDEAFNFDGEQNINQTIKNSSSFRKQVLHYLEAGHSQEGTAKRFGISRKVVRKFASSREESVDCSKEISIPAANPRKRKRE